MPCTLSDSTNQDTAALTITRNRNRSPAVYLAQSQAVYLGPPLPRLPLARYSGKQLHHLEVAAYSGLRLHSHLRQGRCLEDQR